MTSNPKSGPTPEKKPTLRKRAKRRQPSRRYTAEEKARAVLAIWTEKLSQSEICREMEVNYMTLQGWQKRAMEGMLQALETTARLEDGAALSPRLRKLMNTQRARPDPRLDQRLKRIQKGDSPPPA